MIGRLSGFKPSYPEEVAPPRGFDDFDLRLGDVMRGERATMGKSLLDVQRDLKIRASHIAAIENADISAFETQGFVAGFVRSYARYLGLDPEWAYATFCEESGFAGVDAFGTREQPARTAQPEQRARAPRPEFAIQFPDTRPGFFDTVQPGAIGSLMVLVALLAGLGYGGVMLFREVQRVDLAPVEQAPVVVDRLAVLDPVSPAGQDSGSPAAAGPDRLARVYRPQTLDVPVVVARDGPIATLDPSTTGVLAGSARARPFLAETASTAEDEAEAIAAQVRLAENARPTVELVAVRPAWVRVSAPDGTVLFEKILDAGERYAVPETDVAPVLRAGNSGSVFFVVNGQTFGPAGPGTSVAKRVSLAAADIEGGYAVAELPVDMRAGRAPQAVAENGNAAQ